MRHQEWMYSASGGMIGDRPAQLDTEIPNS